MTPADLLNRNRPFWSALSDASLAHEIAAEMGTERGDALLMFAQERGLRMVQPVPPMTLGQMWNALVAAKPTAGDVMVPVGDVRENG